MRGLRRKLTGAPKAAVDAGVMRSDVPRGDTCGHAPCTCPPRESDAFCSDWCAHQSGGHECHCHHGTCHAPHHH